MNKKQLYTAPEAELLVVRFEEGILTNSNRNSINDWQYDGDPLSC